MHTKIHEKVRLAIVGIGCELAAENARYIDEKNRMLRNKRHK
jgi:hypothetical protein